MTENPSSQQDYRNTMLWVIVICTVIPIMYFTLSWGYNLDYTIDHDSCQQLADYLNTNPYIDNTRAHDKFDHKRCSEDLLQ